MGKINLTLFEPHAGQKFIQQNKRQFNCVVCGRRFGKTEMFAMVDWPLLAPAMFEGKRVGVFVPIFKDFEETWNQIVENFEPIIVRKDETEKTIKFVKGGKLEVWSIGDVSKSQKGRSRKYHRVIYEETQKFEDEALKEHWEKTAIPTLTDYMGDAWFIGTAFGKGTFWYKLCQKGAKNGNCVTNSLGDNDLAIEGDEGAFDFVHKDWMTFRMPTSANPYMRPEAIQLLKQNVDPKTALQEFDACFLNYDGEAWVYVLNDISLQNKVFTKSQPINLTSEQFYVSFDFNKIPMTAIVARTTVLPPNLIQQSRYKYGIHIVKEFKIGSIERGEASIYDTCQALREWIFAETGRKIGIWDGKRIPCTLPMLITGDASGARSDGRQKVPMTYYEIIQDELQVSPQMIVIPKANPPHAESYVLTNTTLSKNPDFKIYVDKCPNLKTDLLRIKSNNSRQIMKGKGEERQADLLDCFRYFLNTFCQDIRM
jgi:hypothetical protein